jgi:iron complex outermembrane receptor protein
MGSPQAKGRPRLSETTHTQPTMNKPLLSAASAAARFGLTALICAGSALAQNVTKDTSKDKEEPQKLEKFVVTGSLIPIAAGSPAIPITVINAQEIEKTGVSTDLLEVLKKSEPSFYGANNIGSENGNVASGSTNGGSAVALRNRATLVLINGRRAAISPVIASGGAGFVDVSVIPIAAVERIEVLSDGASATYGSDAVSGVVNIILKTNYTGAEVGGRYGWSPNKGKYAERSYFAVAGATQGKTSVTITTEWKSSDPLIQKERDYATGLFRTPTYAGTLNIGNDFYYLNPSLNAPPTNRDLTAAGVVAAGIYQGPMSQTAVQAFLDLANYPTLKLQAERRSFTAAAEHKLTDNITLFADFIYSLNETESVLNAQPVSGNVAGNNPNNPFDVTVTARNRFLKFPRIYDNESTSIRGVLGMKGTLGGSWTYETAADFNRSNHHYRNKNLIDGAKYTELTNSGAYNPFAREQAAGVIESMIGTQVRDYQSELNSFDVRVNGDLFQLPAGMLQMGFGAETRWETLSFVNDRLDQTGGWLAATPRQPFASRQTVDGFFAEARIPVFGGRYQLPGFHLLEFSAAGRHDIYSKTSDPTVPKYSMRWLPFNDELALRATYSESFSAPSLYDLFGPVSSGFTSGINIVRYNGQGQSLGITTGSRQYRSQSGSNANLNPSQSRNWTAGVVWSPKAVKGFSISADWFNIDERDLISSISSTLIVNDVEQKGAASSYASLVRIGTSVSGESHFTDGTAITAPGQMSSGPSDAVWISNSIVNVAGVWQSGADIQLDYNYDAKEYGRFHLGSATTFIKNYTIQSLPTDTPTNYQDSWSGTSVYARYRVHSRLDWNLKSWSASFANTYVPSIDDIANPTPYRVSRYNSWDIQLGHTFQGMGNRWLKGLNVSVGVNNFTNAMPPYIPSESNQSHDINAYDAIGRFVYMQAKYKF